MSTHTDSSRSSVVPAEFSNATRFLTELELFRIEAQKGKETHEQSNQRLLAASQLAHRGKKVVEEYQKLPRSCEEKHSIRRQMKVAKSIEKLEDDIISDPTYFMRLIDRKREWFRWGRCRKFSNCYLKCDDEDGKYRIGKHWFQLRDPVDGPIAGSKLYPFELPGVAPKPGMSESMVREISSRICESPFDHGSSPEIMQLPPHIDPSEVDDVWFKGYGFWVRYYYYRDTGQLQFVSVVCT